jgi:HK97 gp10 family phage protein
MITGRVNGAEIAIGKLNKLSQGVEDMVARVVTRFSICLTARVKEKLSDDVLHVRTGRLRRSIHGEVTHAPGTVSGTVGTNVEYARRHEFGFVGTENVRASVRMQVKAFGKTMKNPRMVEVKAHQHKVNLPERSFLRSALNELAPELQQELYKEFGKEITASGLD